MRPNKALVALVYGMGVIIVAGLIALIYGVTQKASDPDFSFFKKSGDAAMPVTATNTKLPANVSIPLPPGARIADMQVTGNRIIVQVVEDIDGETKKSGILIIDAQTGDIIKRLNFGK